MITALMIGTILWLLAFILAPLGFPKLTMISFVLGTIVPITLVTLIFEKVLFIF